MNWQPIETAPRDGTEFLGCSFSYGTPDYAVYFWGGKKPWDGFKAVFDIEREAPSPELWAPISPPNHAGAG